MEIDGIRVSLVKALEYGNKRRNQGFNNIDLWFYMMQKAAQIYLRNGLNQLEVVLLFQSDITMLLKMSNRVSFYQMWPWY